MKGEKSEKKRKKKGDQRSPESRSRLQGRGIDEICTVICLVDFIFKLSLPWISRK